MTITYVGGDSDEKASGDSNDLQLTIPSHNEDDFALIFISCETTSSSPTVTFNAGSGWTELFNQQTSTPALPDVTATCYYKKLASSETNPEIEIDGNNDSRTAILEVFRGVSTTNPFDASETSSSFDVEFGSDTSTPTDITTVVDNSCLLVVAFGGGIAITTSSVSVSSGFTKSNSLLEGTDGSLGVSSYLLDAGAPATESPGDWDWNVLLGGAEGDHFTIALRREAISHAGAGTLSATGTASADVVANVIAAGVMFAASTTSADAVANVAGVGTLLASSSLVGNGRHIIRTAGSLSATSSLSASTFLWGGNPDTTPNYTEDTHVTPVYTEISNPVTVNYESE